MKALLPFALVLALAACSGQKSPSNNANRGPSALATMPQKDAKPKLTISNLKGERVAILGNPTSGYLTEKEFIGGDPLFDEMGIHPEGKPKQGLSSATYAGKTGVVVEDTNQVAPDNIVLGKYVIEIEDGGERLETKSTQYICPLSLLQKIKGELEGKTVWARGAFNLYKPGHTLISAPNIKEESTSVANLERLMVSQVEPGVIGAQILVRLKKDDGQEGALYMGTDFGGGMAFKAQFYPGKECGPREYEWDVNKFFYFVDPASQHSDWTPDIWSQVRKGEVTVGMTEEMVAAACGLHFYVQALTVTVDDKGQPKSEWTYECCPNRNFVIEDGKVTKYATGP
ncbi:MAG TPA: hypothetical protein VGJ69_01655 [Pyrinomonadaceae bacterium]|jgi:hypothetical protein